MEQNTYRLSYLGKGIDLFKIQIVNFILNAITLGIYYPWAKAKKLQYLYSTTTIDGHPFAFTGTGKEMFKGFIRAVLLFIALIGVGLYISIGLHMSQFGPLFPYLALPFIIPIAIHGAYKYRMAKTVWKGIRFGYTGDRKELMLLFIKGLFLTIITLGIYGAWFQMDLRKYIFQNIKVGDAAFKYHGDGGKYFSIIIVGYLLTILTLGIYGFWWQKKLFDYFVNNLELVKDDKKINFYSIATVGGFFELVVLNLLLIVFTVGIAFPWTIVRTMKFFTDNIVLEGEMSLDELQQSQSDFSNATGDDITDILDLGIVI